MVRAVKVVIAHVAAPDISVYRKKKTHRRVGDVHGLGRGLEGHPSHSQKSAHGGFS
jgi:hypothetical protein